MQQIANTEAAKLTGHSYTILTFTHTNTQLFSPARIYHQYQTLFLGRNCTHYVCTRRRLPACLTTGSPSGRTNKIRNLGQPPPLYIPSRSQQPAQKNQKILPRFFSFFIVPPGSAASSARRYCVCTVDTVSHTSPSPSHASRKGHGKVRPLKPASPMTPLRTRTLPSTDATPSTGGA